MNAASDFPDDKDALKAALPPRTTGFLLLNSWKASRRERYGGSKISGLSISPPCLNQGGVPYPASLPVYRLLRFPCIVRVRNATVIDFFRCPKQYRCTTWCRNLKQVHTVYLLKLRKKWEDVRTTRLVAAKRRSVRRLHEIWRVSGLRPSHSNATPETVRRRSRNIPQGPAMRESRARDRSFRLLSANSGKAQEPNSRRDHQGSEQSCARPGPSV
jgi:hypothetical protein